MSNSRDLGYYIKRTMLILKDEGFISIFKHAKRKVVNQILYKIPQDTSNDPNIYDVSVIIPVYNAASFTKACIEKLYASANAAHYEVLVIDNGSSDETEELLKEEKAKRPDFSYFRMAENLGFSGGVNFGFLNAKGRYIIILNNDTLVTPGWIDRLIEAFKIDELIGIVSPITNFVGEGPQVDKNAVGIDKSRIDEYAALIKDRGITYESHRLVFFCVALRREVIDQLGLMDTGYVKGNFEDDDYCARAIMAGFKLAIANSAFVYHYGSMTFKENKIFHDDFMDRNRKRFYPKVQNLSLTLKPAKQLSGMIDVSVVVRTLNRPFLLKKALTSLANQTYRDFEVVLVNDGGEDVGDLVSFYQKYFPIQYIHHDQSKGRTPALNVGVTHSKGRWVGFLDDDDILFPWHLELLHQYLTSQKDCRLAYSNYNRSIFRTNQDEYAFVIQGVEPWSYDKKDLWVSNHTPIHTWLLAKDSFDKVGLFDETMQMLEDFEFLIRLSNITDFLHVDRVSCDYRFYLDGLNSTVNQRTKTLEALRFIYAKHQIDDPEINKKRESELEGLQLQIKTIEKINEEYAQNPENSDEYQRKMLSRILGIS